MSGQIEFIPLINNKKIPGISYLLIYEDIKILLDCGWDFSAEREDIAKIQSIAMNIDAVLLSSHDIDHIGAYPYLFSNCCLTCPVYATFPIVKMSHLMFYDWYQTLFEFSIPKFSLDEIDSAIEHIKQVKYSQKMYLKSSSYSISVTAYPSGVTVGGCIWLIEIDGGDTKIVYAPDINHQNDRHLQCLDLNQIPKPTILITSSLPIERNFIKKSAVEDNLVQSIKSTLLNKGSVLLVSDTSGRCLEILLLFSEMYNSNNFLKNSKIFFVSHTAFHAIESAKFQLEWMNESLLKTFQSDSKNPFDLNFLSILHSFNNVDLSYPSVFIASDVCLEQGYGFKFINSFCQNNRNKIIFTKPCSSYSNLSRISSLIDSFEISSFFRAFDSNCSNLIDSKQSEDSAIEEDINFSDDDLEDNKNDTHGFFKLPKPKFIFPIHKDDSNYDSYGQVVKPDSFVSLILDSNTDDQVMYQNEQIKEAVDHKRIDPSSLPYSFQPYTLQYKRVATIEHILFDGILDGESLSTIIQMIQPSILIIVRGSSEHSKTLEVIAGERLQIKSIYIADSVPSVTLTDERKSLKVRLQNNLLSALEFKSYGDQDVAWIDFNASKPIQLLSLKESNYQLDLPIDFYNKAHSSIFLKELKIPDLCQLLTEKGYKIRFECGVLSCNDGAVSIKRGSDGKIYVIGKLSKDYFNIRDLIYNQFCII